MAKVLRVLLVEDSRDDADMLVFEFERAGYDVVSYRVETAAELEQALREGQWDMVLADYSLPSFGAVAALEIVKRFESNLPFIVVSGTISDETAVAAMKAGAHDYIMKDNLGRLVPAVERGLEDAKARRERERAERSLQQTSQMLEALVISSPHAITIVDHGGYVMMWNPAAERLFGWTEAEVVGHLYPAVTENQRGEFLSLVRSTLNGQVQVDVEAIRRRKDGSTVEVSISTAPLYDQSGRTFASMGIVTDISAQKRAMRSLQEATDRLQKVLEGTVNAFSRTLEIRDPYTAGHERRVSQLACRIAGELGLSEDEIEGIRIASLLHDLGKIAVPAEILSKPGTISDAERELIKNHPQTGFDILGTVEFPWPVAETVLQHHERLDGTGYPRGITGDQILLPAQVLSVADVVESMCSHRPYRPVLSVRQALREIAEKSGTFYEPRVVDACLKLFREERFKFD